jgi:hypothetical protein
MKGKFKKLSVSKGQAQIGVNTGTGKNYSSIGI